MIPTQVLAAIATEIEADAQAVTTANATRGGYWKRIALAAESMAGQTFPGNDSIGGWASRAAQAIEFIADSSSNANTNEAGYIRRMAAALESTTGETVGSWWERLRAALVDWEGGTPAVFTQPYNRKVILGPGDSRTQQALGSGGTYGSGAGTTFQTTTGVNAVLAQMMDNAIILGEFINGGVGGQKMADALTIPRPSAPAGPIDITTTAASDAAIVILWGGTNDDGSLSDLPPAFANAIQGLTDPTFVYPGLGTPLPLFEGRPKNIILFNETRQGVTTLGDENALSTEVWAPAFAAFADHLMTYSFDSGHANANPRVIGVDTFNDPRMANLADTVLYRPKPGLLADGLHQAPTGSFTMALVAAERVLPVLTPGINFASLPTVATAANYFNANPCITTTTGGTTAMASGGTLVGTVPSGWRLATSSGTGLTITPTYADLGDGLGNQLVARITGTPTSNAAVTWRSSATSGQLNAVNLATDTLRASVRSKLTIAAGSVYEARFMLEVQAGSLANARRSYTGLMGGASGYGNNAAFLNTLNNPYVKAEHAEWWTEVAPDVSLAGLATGSPSSVVADYILRFVAGVEVDVTLTLAQMGIARVSP